MGHLNRGHITIMRKPRIRHLPHENKKLKMRGMSFSLFGLHKLFYLFLVNYLFAYHYLYFVTTSYSNKNWDIRIDLNVFLIFLAYSSYSSYLSSYYLSSYS